MAGGAIAARAMHLLQHRRGGGQRQARAAVGLGDEDGEIAFLGEGRHERGRIGPLAVQRLPVASREARAEPAHRLADVRMSRIRGRVWSLEHAPRRS